MTGPNIFHYATSELSQDAFICWLLAWSDPTYDGMPMHEIGMDFLRELYSRSARVFPDKIATIEVRKQDKNIDVQCIVNGNSVILIEDKTQTVQHSEQLQRYKKTLLDTGFSEEQIIPFYIQTGDQSDFGNAYKHGYTVFLRKDFLLFFTKNENIRQQINNQILENFVSHLSTIEDRVQSFRSLPLAEWNWDSWKGFFSELQMQLGTGAWSYVANPAGGFLGFFWGWYGDENCEQYLQLEQGKLCFKIWVKDRESRAELRDKYYCVLIAAGEKYGQRIIRPARMGMGEYMTVAILGNEYRICNDNGMIDIPKTVAYLRELTEILENALEEDVKIKI